MLAVSQSVGNIPELNDCVNIICRTGSIWLGHDLYWLLSGTMVFDIDQ